MAKVKLGFSGLSVPVQIERARNIIQKLVLNPDFPSPNPTLAVMGTAINKLESA